ncbi:hypothetical protein DID88_003093 [Monilinia fructigena]|uniref:Uncharacterized protein n=1 Tax=Monilinia fructigena TaxID=38457 RepID=A0A395IUC5_9HELO|nr:hypothetical protein DID88_003093 [Monilinia fructigena]
MDAGMMLMSVFPTKHGPNTVRTRRSSPANAASLNRGTKSKKTHRKILQKNAISVDYNVAGNFRLGHDRGYAMLAGEENLMDVLLNRKLRHRTRQPKMSNSKPKASTIPNCAIIKTRGGDKTTIIDSNSAIKHQSPIILATLQYSEVNARVAVFCISTGHSHFQASILSLSTLGSPEYHSLTNSINSQSSPQVYHPLRGFKVMSPENEAKMDKFMERVTGINCRRGLGMQSEDIGSVLSYGYGFYWTCCNDICAKARVMGNLGGVMEVVVKAPYKRKNALAEEKCRECGHLICAICEKMAECAESYKEKRVFHVTD